MSNYRVNAGFISHHRNRTIDSLFAADTTFTTPFDTETMVPVIVASFLGWLRQGKDEWTRVQARRDRLAKDFDGHPGQQWTVRGIYEQEQKIMEQQAHVETEIYQQREEIASLDGIDDV